MKLCLHCQKPRTAGSSFCSKECALAWDRIRKNKDRKNKKEETLTCIVCGTPFQHRDKRKKTCSNKCTYALRAKKMQDSLGYSNPSQKPRTEEEKQLISRNKSVASKKDSNIREAKRQKTMLEKYNTVCVAHTEESKAKRRKTNLNRYGGVSPFSDKTVREKAKNTIMQKYGCSEYVQSEMWKKQMQEKYGVEQVFSSDAFLAQMDKKGIYTSVGESEVRDFINSLGFKAEKYRKLGFEIDIYIPDINVGIVKM